jgi:beta-mannosidase
MMQSLNLNGTWKLRWADGQRGRLEYAAREQTDPERYIDARVPGEVHLDAWRAGWIADPYVGTNCLAARWVEEHQWAYRREFDVPAEALRGRSWLVFERLDLAATVILNGKEVGRQKNVFHPCRIEVTGSLKAGRNILAVNIESGLYHAGTKPLEEGMARFPDHPLHKSFWLRKPQCQFGWDWSTRFVNVGITGPVRLEWTADQVRLDQFVPLVELSPDLKTGKVRARLFVEGLAKRPVRAELSAEVAGCRCRARVMVKPGLNSYEVEVAVENPRLWWPVGHGPQNRYPVRAALRVGGRLVGERSAKVGFRHVRVNQDPHPEKGRYFVIEVNGRRIFAKGGNFVPADMIFARIDRRRYDVLTDRALEANFNMLRVWGGGLYEGDDFYDLCDRKGILVWQEFIFACLKYPVTDQEFHESVKAEAAWNVRRLAEHPSLVVWCGNNELEWGCWEWGFDQGAVYPDYSLFHLTLPRILAREDPTRYYQPSSPFSPDGQHPNADELGDQHPWSVGFADLDFHKYRRMTCRFPNEGGFLGPTSLPTVLACLPEGQRRLQSFAWQVHDNAISNCQEPSPTDRITMEWLGKDSRRMSMEEYVYWGGLVHGEALSEYCANFRRRMFDSASAIFWMYNDCWPATRSWTIVDYYLRRTPAFHPVRRTMAPVSVVVAEEGGEVAVFGINETAEAVSAELRYGIFKLGGGFPMDRRAAAELPPNSSVRLAGFPLGAWKDQKGSAAFAMLEDGGRLVARHRLFLPRFKDLRWAPARIRVRLEKGRAVFESPTFAWGVCLDLDGERQLADNFFDIYPGVAYSIPWKGRRSPKVLRVGNLRGR